MLKKVVVKGSASRYGMHPWIYSGNVINTNGATTGEHVVVYTRKGVFLGSALFNSESDIAIRFYSRKKEPLDYSTIKERLFNAEQLRRSMHIDNNAYRVVFSESDMLPGLIVDKYGMGFVIQVSSAGMEKRKRDIINAIVDLFNPNFIYEKSSLNARTQEGMENLNALIYGEFEDGIEVLINGIKFQLDIERSQKTGLFLDQSENWDAIEKYAEEKDVLDLYAYTGGFTLHALRGRARRVYAVEQDKNASTKLLANVKLNNYNEKRIMPFTEDVVQFLREFKSTGLLFDLIVIDPPSFSRSKKTKERGIFKYREILSSALVYLKKGGMIALFSCSSYVKRDDLIGVIRSASSEKGREFLIVREMTQAKDHPVPVNFPESKYLNGFLLKERII